MVVGIVCQAGWPTYLVDVDAQHLLVPAQLAQQQRVLVQEVAGQALQCGQQPLGVVGGGGAQELPQLLLEDAAQLRGAPAVLGWAPATWHTQRDSRVSWDAMWPAPPEGAAAACGLEWVGPACLPPDLPALLCGLLLLREQPGEQQQEELVVQLWWRAAHGHEPVEVGHGQGHAAHQRDLDLAAGRAVEQRLARLHGHKQDRQR